MKIISLTFLVFLLCVNTTQAQEIEEEKEIKHNVALVFGITHIPKTISE